MRTNSAILTVLGTLTLASCGNGASDQSIGGIDQVPDPLVSRTLNDPLMVDPDLAYRNEANAIVTIRHDHALPPHMSSSETAERARDAARRELLETGPVRDHPTAIAEEKGEELSLGMSAADIIKAVGAPSKCNGKLEEGLVWAARMPDPARVMPHGMSLQAAGSDGAECYMRIVRYVTPAGLDDVLQYHFNRADRARMRATRHSKPEAILDASRGSEHLIVHARPGSAGTTRVDLIYWNR